MEQLRPAGRAGSRHGHPLPDIQDNKAEHTAELGCLPGAGRQDDANRSGRLASHTTLRGAGGALDAARRHVIQIAAGLPARRPRTQDWRSRRDVKFSPECRAVSHTARHGASDRVGRLRTPGSTGVRCRSSWFRAADRTAVSMCRRPPCHSRCQARILARQRAPGTGIVSRDAPSWALCQRTIMMTAPLSVRSSGSPGS